MNVNRLCLYEPFVLPEPEELEDPSTFDGRDRIDQQQHTQHAQPIKNGAGNGVRKMSDTKENGIPFPPHPIDAF